jgi:hypothetical protein
MDRLPTVKSQRDEPAKETIANRHYRFDAGVGMNFEPTKWGKNAEWAVFRPCDGGKVAQNPLR